MMKINVMQAKKEIGGKQVFSFVTSAEKLGISDGQLCDDNKITIDGQVVNNGRVLEVTGTIRFTAHYQCDRCLNDFELFRELSFSEEYQESTETTDEETDITFFQGDEIDITEFIRETILLAQPLQNICSEDCRGLCIKCGTNLNTAECACDRQIIDPRLAALQKFFDKD